MKDILDVHTHTLASGHAYNTIYEMARAASEKKLEILGITEHAPKMPGSCYELYFLNLQVIPREMVGVRLLFGAELNIMDFNGTVDLPEAILKKMDLCIASIHPPCFKSGSISENTQAVIKAMQNPYINIIGHPDDARFPLDYEKLVLAAKEHHVLLEINNSSLASNGYRLNAAENYRTMLQLCKEAKVSIIMNSDAHIASDVGNHQNALKLIEETDFPENLIANTSTEKLMEYLNS